MKLMIRFYSLILLILVSYKFSYSQVIAYHPNSHWHIPGELSQKNSKYPFNYFFGQYYYPRKFKDGTWQSSEWREWIKLNHFSYEYPLEGHSWQAVVQRNKDIFQVHPEYLAMINGKRGGYGKTTKLCVSNKDLQKLFIEDRIKAFEALNDPDGSVSVEPSDGGGFCQCEACSKLGKISNQVFTLANITARALRAKYPNAKVNLYAYYKHAAIPDFDLERNVHVTVIPDGFQQAYDGDVMMALWAEKAHIKTYYEYFTIPQQKGELPRLYIQNFIRRMELAKKLGYQGYWFETGLNLNSAIALQLFNQLWLDNNLTWEAITEKFLRNSFKGSYIPMKRLFNRWWHTWLAEEEIPMAIYDLEEASSLAKNKDEKERITDLKAYLHYIILYEEWNKNRKDSEKTKRYFNYLYESSNRMIVNVSALYQIFGAYIPKEERSKLNVQGKNNWGWLKPLTTADINQLFESDKKQYGVKKSNYLYKEVDVASPASKLKNNNSQTIEFQSKLTGKKQFYGKGEITITFINPKDIATQNDKRLAISILGKDGNVVINQHISYDKPQLTIKLPKEGLYTISLMQFFTTKTRISGNVYLLTN